MAIFWVSFESVIVKVVLPDSSGVRVSGDQIFPVTSRLALVERGARMIFAEVSTRTSQSRVSIVFHQISLSVRVIVSGMSLMSSGSRPTSIWSGTSAAMVKLVFPE